jgi:hypothetical protein
MIFCEECSVVYFDAVTGGLSDVLPVLKRKVSSYQRGAVKFKIGISVDPESRWGSHKQSRHDWDKMIVIYQTSSHDYVCRAESGLIDFSAEKYSHKCQNKISGGGGINEPDSYGRFFLYMLIKR